MYISFQDNLLKHFNEITAFCQGIYFWVTIIIAACTGGFWWLKTRPYISLKDAIKEISRGEYYNFNTELEKMWEGMGVKEESYNQNIIIPLIKKGEIPLYGCRIFPATKRKRISLDKISNNQFNSDFSCITSALGEDKYKELSIKKKHLSKLIKSLKNKVN
jgi:hypothetical protein